MKVCKKCEREMPPEAFNKYARSKDGLQYMCRECSAAYNKKRFDSDPEKHRAASLAAQRANPVAARARRNRHKAKLGEAYKTREYNRHLFKSYGITLADYEAMVERQNGECAICRSAKIWLRKRSLVVDHNHKTGKVRGLLCNQCNTAIGHLADCAQTAQRLVNYLKAGDA